MINIELELVSDVNLDQALGILARTLVTGRRSHRAGAWRSKPVQKLSSMPASISSCSHGLRRPGNAESASEGDPMGNAA